MGHRRMMHQWMGPFLVGMLIGTAATQALAQRSAPDRDGAVSVAQTVAGDGGSEATGLAARRYDIFVDERKQVEQNLGFTLGEVVVLTPQPDARGYYTHVGAANLIALTGPWFREDQVRQTAAHELGHLAHTLAGITFGSDAEREAWAETFRGCFGSIEARAPRWGPAAPVDPSSCAAMRQAIRSGMKK